MRMSFIWKLRFYQMLALFCTESQLNYILCEVTVDILLRVQNGVVNV